MNFKFFSFLFTFLMAVQASAVVDMMSANYSDPWVDIEVPGTGYDLTVRRTYNSRSQFNGMFGYGWCSNFETKLNVRSDGSLLLTECGSGDEITFTPKNFSKKDVKETISEIIAGMKKSGQRLNDKYFKELESQLFNDPDKREQLAKQYGVTGSAKEGTVYYANGSTVETIAYNKKQYVRQLTDSTTQTFDQEGRLSRTNDKNGNYLNFVYNDKNLEKVTDNNSRQLNFTFYQNGKVKKITAPNGLKSTYDFNNVDLAAVENSWGNKYTFKYDELHNLTLIVYPDKTSKALSYDKNKDWVTSFKHRNGCEEKYSYDFDKKDAKRHYWTTLTKVCEKKVTNKSRFEFLFKPGTNGKGDYLAKALTDINGNKTEVEYHPVHEKPIYYKQNGVVTKYAYYDNGLLKAKTIDKVTTNFKYEGRCKKVSEVKVSKSTTLFSYDNKCNLTSAKNNGGQIVNLDYDRNGRIVSLMDQAKRRINIEYEEKLGKPSVVDRPGVGALRVSYKADGEIDKVDSKAGPTVAVQVASAFNNLIELIRPAGVDLGI